MAADRFVLAVDLGTSGVKVGLVSTSGRVIDWASRPVPLLLLPEGGAEQDPGAWWQAVGAASRLVVGRATVRAPDIVAVACTSQWSGTVPVADSRHLSNAIIWMDSRGAQEIARLIKGPISLEGYALNKLTRWIRRTGGAPGRSGKDPIAHILHVKTHLPDLYRATTVFLEPKDYLNLRLTGEVAAGFDSIALHWVTDNRDLNRVRYDPGLLTMSGIDPAKLPPLRRPNAILGPLTAEAAEHLGVLAGIPVAMGTPDVQSAAVGSGAVDDLAGHLYLGTSSWITCHVPFKKTDLLHGIGSLPSAIPGRYLAANEQESAGACLTYLADNLKLTGDPTAQSVYAGFDRVAEGIPAGSGGVIFTPWLNGERSPVDDHLVRAGFFNQSLATTSAELIRSVFEGVALNSRWLLGYLERFAKHRMTELRAVGGGAGSSVWCQIYADVLDRTILQIRDPILAGIRGVALLAAVELGFIGYGDIPARVEIAARFQPDPANRAVYDAEFAEFRNLYKATKKINARLAK